LLNSVPHFFKDNFVLFYRPHQFWWNGEGALYSVKKKKNYNGPTLVQGYLTTLQLYSTSRTPVILLNIFLAVCSLGSSKNLCGFQTILIDWSTISCLSILVLHFVKM
jgi:hypothetical protein